MAVITNLLEVIAGVIHGIITVFIIYLIISAPTRIYHRIKKREDRGPHTTSVMIIAIILIILNPLIWNQYTAFAGYPTFTLWDITGYINIWIGLIIAGYVIFKKEI